MLLSRHTAWKQAVPYLQRPHSSANQSHLLDLAGGVFVHYAVSRNPQLIITSLPSRAFEERTIEVEKLDVLLDSHAVDPSQDLLAFVQGHVDPDDPVMEEGLAGSDVDGRVTVHLRSLSSPAATAHKEFLPILKLRSQYSFLSGSSLHIAGYSIALFSPYPNPLFIVWNGRTGTQLLVRFIHSPCVTTSLTRSFYSPWAITTSSELACNVTVLHLLPLLHSLSPTPIRKWGLPCSCHSTLLSKRLPRKPSEMPYDFCSLRPALIVTYNTSQSVRAPSLSRNLAARRSLSHLRSVYMVS